MPRIASAVSTTFGMRVMPPTNTNSSISSVATSASRKQASTGPRVRSNKSSQICSSLAREICALMCLGPLASAVMNGRLMS